MRFSWEVLDVGPGGLLPNPVVPPPTESPLPLGRDVALSPGSTQPHPSPLMAAPPPSPGPILRPAALWVGHTATMTSIRGTAQCHGRDAYGECTERPCGLCYGDNPAPTRHPPLPQPPLP